jgi:hypothetical protein
MREIIEKIIEKYYREEEDYYSRYRYDEKDEEFQVNKEIEEAFNVSELQHSVIVEECYDSPGYDCNMLIISWIENNKLETDNTLLECM